MKNKMTKIFAVLLALCMVLSIVVCNNTPKLSNSNTLTVEPNLQDLLPDKDKNVDKELTEEKLPEITREELEELTREELETIVDIMEADVDTSKLTDKELYDFVDRLLNDLDNKKDTASVDVNQNKDAYDQNGAMTKPFDTVYPEMIEDGLVEYSDEALLIKMSNSKKGKLSAALKNAGVLKLEEIFPLEKATWYKASIKKGADAKAVLENVRKLDEVILAEYDYKIKTSAIDGYQDLDDRFGFENNKHKKDQWYMHHCGIPEGFNYMKYDGGQPNVIVAVIDTGVDIDHEDLEHNIWKNTKEKPDNGIDDDKNGYVDDYYGVNIITGKGNGDDDNGHGTHVAGIIAARNNNIGTVGIAHKTTIMPVKAAMASGYLLQSDIAKAVLYAYENGAEVINMSFGGTACSIAVQDALATAYTRAVLVASAGNDGENNEPTPTDLIAVPNYPAALTYVLGVMAVDETGRETNFTNWDYKLYNGVEYELYAPGYNIMSTLPDNRYGSLSGTSMAAPVVSAMAAILRSEFADRDTYPTKFIYGQLTSTSEHYATCLNPDAHGPHNIPQIVNLHDALTKLPKPDVGMQDFAIFDSEGIKGDSGKNNGDGVIDAGETIALGLTLRNRWGMSQNTKVTIDAKSNAGIADPYVTFVNPTVNYDTVGTYSTRDCGKIYTDELHTGWENPFIVKIAKDCPNDYIIKVNVHLEYENGLDSEDKTVYTNELEPISFEITVRNGVVLPSIIDEDMTLTPDNLYIIPNSTVIEEGATVRVRPGTNIQFWSDDPKDPYADTYIAYLSVKGKFLVEGTKENPVNIYPSDLMNNYIVNIGGSNGFISLKYANITNFAYNSFYYSISNKIDYADHCTFRFNYGTNLNYRYLESGKVINSPLYSHYLAHFNLIENSVFYKVGLVNNSYSTELTGTANRCIFADCSMNYSSLNAQNCVFLGNTFLDQTRPNSIKNSSMTVSSTAELTSDKVKIYYNESTGHTYIRTTTPFSPELLKNLNATYVIINDETESVYLGNNLGGYTYNCGIEFDHKKQQYTWCDGAAVPEFLDKDNLLSTFSGKKLSISLSPSRSYLKTGTSSYSIYEIPGKILPTDITFNEYEVNIDTNTTYQILPKNEPVQLGVEDFIYESCDESVVKVSKDGIVTPVGDGTTDVYVYSEDKAVKNFITFNVVDYVALEDFTFTAEKDVVAVGETIATNVSFTPDNTTRKNVKYTSSDNSIVKVDNAGNLTGISSGTATITATCEGITKQITVKSFVKATTLQFDTAVKAITLDGGAVALPSVVTNDGAETDYTWRSIDETIATVTDDKVIPHALGTTTIEVTDNNSGLKATFAVLVRQEVGVKIKKVSTDNSYHLVLLENGELYYWGSASTKPTLVLTDIKDISQTQGNIFKALKNDNTILKYYEYDSYISRNEVNNYFVGKDNIKLGESYTSEHTFVITDSGNVYAWGSYNTYGELGVGTFGDVDTPQLVNLDNIVQVYETSNTTYFLTAEGDIYYAGSPDYAQTTPKLLVSGAKKITYASNDNILYVTNNGDLAKYYLKNQQTSLLSLSIEFDYLTYKYYSFLNADLGNYGIGLKNGKAYFVSGMGVITPIIGIDNAVYCYSDGTTHYIATEDGMLFGVGANSLSENSFAGVTTETHVTYPVFIPLKPIEEDAKVISHSQQGNSYVITFNKELKNVSPKLYADGEQITFNYEINNLNQLVITRKEGFNEGVQYSLTIDAGKAVCALGVTNSEAIIVNFTCTAVDTPTQTPDTDQGENTPADTPITEKVVHNCVVDETIERILTVEHILDLYEQLNEQYNDKFYNNAILNRISTDTTVEHWLRLLAPETSGTKVALGGNYWGTVNETAIGHQLIDYNDFINYGRFMYEPFLTEAPEDTFPFVTSVKVFNKDKQEVYTVGNEQITVRVTFNRDMDISIPLQVRFGSAYPYGDYEIEGKYVDARTWEGKYKLTTIIEGGTQYFTIENGYSATDDLVLMRDRARFSFEIDTTAAQALIMQGQATDTGIKLSWTQDDFDTLMGYNVYRATSEDGLYTRVNTSVIPADTMEFFDDTVEPGVLYYYNFTVVQTDLSESIPSGKIVIMSKDTMAPDIYHSPVYNATTGSNLVISATVTDNLNITYARVYYRTKGESDWRIAVMNNLNDKYSAIIIADHINIAGLEYYIEAFDGVSYTYKGSAENPYAVAVQEVVSGDAIGDVNGDGVITNIDALMLLKAINDQLNLTAEQFARADLDGNGEIAAKEALCILQYVSGAIGSVDMRA